jgi:membrane-bound metal-dependent hydrolase YbcI (DUF457 family)
VNAKTHLTGAGVAGLAAGAAWGLGPAQTLVLFAAALPVASLPDKDRLLNPGRDHRSWPHSIILGGGGILIAAYYLSRWLVEEHVPLLALAPYGVAAGYLSHLMLDALTGAGVWVLAPGGPRVRLASIELGGPGEDLVRGSLWAAGGLIVLYAWLPDILHGGLVLLAGGAS